MAEIKSDDITFGLGVTGIVLFSIIGLLIVVGLVYFAYTKELFTSLYYSTINFFRLFFVNNETINKSDICSIVPSNSPVPRIPSLFVAHVAFFFGFLLANAVYLYKYKNDDTTGEKSQLNNRMYRAATSIFLLIVVFLFILFARYNTTNCESLSGILFTSFIFGGLGNLWYKIGDICGLKLTDIFGVTQSIISKSAQAPLVCSTT